MEYSLGECGLQRSEWEIRGFQKKSDIWIGLMKLSRAYVNLLCMDEVNVHPQPWKSWKASKPPISVR